MFCIHAYATFLLKKDSHWWIFPLEQKFVEMVFSIHVCKISLPTDDRLPWMIRFAYHSCNKNKIYKSKCKSGFSWTRWWYLVQFINITIPKVKVKFIQLNYYWLFLNIVFIQLFCENTKAKCPHDMFNDTKKFQDFKYAFKTNVIWQTWSPLAPGKPSAPGEPWAPCDDKTRY